MKFRSLFLAIVAAFLSLTIACDSDTEGIGSIMMPQRDSLSTYTEVFPIVTRSIKTGPVIANTSSCYLGRVIDPETRAQTTCSFLAQFHIQENYSLPDKSLVVKDDNGNIVADSCILRLYHEKFYGDSLTTMTLTATDLGFDHLMEEGTTFYTDINPELYVNKVPKVHATASYTVRDQTLADSETSLSSGNYRAIPIHLGADYGTYILNSYYDHPEYFKNSYTFIHNVCPGMYVKHTGGIGTLVNPEVSVLDVYFHYQKNDTTTTKAWMRLGATQEVIQNTQFSHEVPEDMLLTDAEHPYTYIKSPAGIHTEIVLPIKEMIAGEHYNDTINSVRLSLRRYSSQEQNNSNLNPTNYVLLIRKGYVDEFFSEHKLPDSETTFLTSYNSTTNAYTFTNLATLVAYLRKFRDSGAGVLDTDNESERQAKWDVWEAANPDWQTFELLPVTTESVTSTSSSYYGYTSSSTTLIGVHNNFNLNSVKLEGSPAGEVKVNVIYSRFDN